MATIPNIYLIEGRAKRDYSECAERIAALPAKFTLLPMIVDPHELIERTRDADALIVVGSPITREVMRALPRLKAVVRTGVGYDVVDVGAATELGIVVVNIPDFWTREVANHALGMLLMWNRRLAQLDREVRGGVWSARVPGDPIGAIYNETIGIVGLGRIGSAFARRARALDATVIAHDPYASDAHFAAVGVERVTLEQLAARSDYVSVHTWLSAETRHLIGEDFLRRMKPTAFLINTARGPVVDTQALMRALEARQIAGAALDVWEREPVPADHPLLRLDNVIASSHAAYFSTYAVSRVPRRAGEEAARVLLGERPLHPVNPEVYGTPGHRDRAAG